LNISQSFSYALSFRGSQHPENIEYLLCIGEIIADISVVPDIDEMAGLKRIDRLIPGSVSDLPEAEPSLPIIVRQ